MSPVSMCFTPADLDDVDVPEDRRPGIRICFAPPESLTASRPNSMGHCCFKPDDLDDLELADVMGPIERDALAWAAAPGVPTAPGADAGSPTLAVAEVRRRGICLCFSPTSH